MEISASTYDYGRNDPFEIQRSFDTSHIHSLAPHPYAGMETRSLSNHGPYYCIDSGPSHSPQIVVGGVTNRMCLPPIASLLDFARAGGESNGWDPSK